MEPKRLFRDPDLATQPRSGTHSLLKMRRPSEGVSYSLNFQKQVQKPGAQVLERQTWLVSLSYCMLVQNEGSVTLCLEIGVASQGALGMLFGFSILSCMIKTVMKP